MKLTYDYKIWIEYRKRSILGNGRYQLLKGILKTRSLKKSAKKVGITPRTAYNYIKRMEKHLGKPVVESFKGGKTPGGYVLLRGAGMELIKKYEEVRGKLK